MNNKDQKREHNGRFARDQKTLPAIELMRASQPIDAGSAGPGDLDSMLDSNDALVRAEVASSVYVTDELLEEMAQSDQPVEARLAAVQTMYGGTADRAADDPSPIVRAAAYTNWDLSEKKRSQLDTDPGVQRLIGLISV